MTEHKLLKKNFFEGIELVNLKRLREAREKFIWIITQLPSHSPSWENALFCSIQLAEPDALRQIFISIDPSLRSIDGISLFAANIQDELDINHVLFSLIVKNSNEQDGARFRKATRSILAKLASFDFVSNTKSIDNGEEFYQNHKYQLLHIDEQRFAIVLESLCQTDATTDTGAAQYLIRLAIDLVGKELFLKPSFQLPIVSALHSTEMFEKLAQLVTSSCLKGTNITRKALPGILDSLNKTQNFKASIGIMESSNIEDFDENEILLFIESLERCYRIPEAIDLLNNAIPRLSSPPLRRELVRLLSEDNQLPKARQLIEYAQGEGREDTILEKHLSKILLYSGDYSDALKLLNRLLSKEPNDRDLRQARAESLIGLGRFGEGFCELYRMTGNEFIPRFSDSNIQINGDQGIGDQLLFLQMLKRYEHLLDGVTFSYSLNQKIAFLLSQPSKPSPSPFKNITSTGIPAFFIQNLGEGSFRNIFVSDLNPTIPSISELNEADICGKTIAVCLGSTAVNIRRQKTISWNSILGALRSKDYRFMCLEYAESSRAEAQELNDARIIFPDCDVFNDIDKVHKIIQECDHVIVGSNSFAHLAGWLNKPTSLILTEGFGRIWYWRSPFIVDGRSTIYPKTKLYLK